MMLPTISFEIHDFKNDIHGEFLILNTIENQEKVLTHRHTRDIKFGKTFEGQFKREMRMPAEFIDSRILVGLFANLQLESVA